MKFTTVKFNQPLYGRCDTIIHLRPFATSVLKQTFSDYYPGYDNSDMIVLLTIIGEKLLSYFRFLQYFSGIMGM